MQTSNGLNNTIDRVLGDQYSVVKTVYSKLPVLEDFKNNSDVEFIKDNLDVLKSINRQEGSLDNINSNLPEILKAPEYIAKMQSNLEASQNQGRKQIQDATEVADRIKSEAGIYKTAVDTVNEFREQIEINANNIGHIKVNSENINSINTVADFIEGTHNEPDRVLDLGVIGSEDHVPELGTSPIDVIAHNIQAIQTIYAHIDELIELASKLDLDKLMELANNINSYLEQIRLHQDSIDKALKEINVKMEDLDIKSREHLREMQDIMAKFESKYDEYHKKLSDLVNETTNIKQECQDILDACISKLLSMQRAHALLVEEIASLGAEWTANLQATGDAQVKKILRAAEGIKDTINSSIGSTTEEIISTVKAKLEKVQADALLDFKLDIADAGNKVKTEIANTSSAIKADLTDFAEKTKREMNKQAQEILDSLNSPLSNVYRYQGNVPTVEDLNNIRCPCKGDVYNVSDTDMNYAWTGCRWDALGGVVNKNKDEFLDLGVIGS